MRARIPRLSLRWRVAAAFGLVSLVLTGALAVATWNLATGYMLHQHELSATRQAAVSAQLVDTNFDSDDKRLQDLLTGLTSGTESSVLVVRQSGWLISGRQVDPQSLPRPLVTMAENGVAAHQRVNVDNVLVLAVAVPLTAPDGTYVQLFSMSQTDHTFTFLSSVLVVGTAGSVLLSIALGAWAGRRALRPLTELTAAASLVARGDLQARLPEHKDPDLAPLAATFNRTAVLLEARVLRDARFASDVSHELRSPLTTMANAGAVLARRRSELTGTAGRALDLLLLEVERFQRMVVDLLEISRGDQQPETAAGEPVALTDVVRHVLRTRPEPAPNLQLANPSPVVIGDRRRLDRIVVNLLENAKTYGGGVVRVAVQSQERRIRLEVDDAGPGVPVEMRERIFERFARGAWAGRRGDNWGSGLGLALVAQHVARHAGKVWVEDRPGGGARFVVEFPEARR